MGLLVQMNMTFIGFWFVVLGSVVDLECFGIMDSSIGRPSPELIQLRT